MENSMNGLMQNALEHIRSMIDVNTIIGKELHLTNGTVILPVSRVSFGFAAGGTNGGLNEEIGDELAGFGGGTGAGVSVKPVGFLVCSGDSVRFLNTDRNSMAEQLADYVPQAVELVKDMVGKKQQTAKAAADLAD